MASAMRALSSILRMMECVESHISVALMLGDHRTVRSILPSLLRSALLLRPFRDHQQLNLCGAEQPPRPSRKLRASRVPMILPHLAAEYGPSTRRSIADALDYAQYQYRNGTAPGAILDRFQAMSGLPWISCQGLLLREKLLPEPIEEEQITAILRAREFWRVWADASEVWEAAVTLGQIRPVGGDWGIVEHARLQLLLPGLLPPAEEKRHEYLIRLIRSAGLTVELWLYSMTYRPAFWLMLGQSATTARRRRRGSEAGGSMSSSPETGK
jgi:hypothetical protein